VRTPSTAIASSCRAWEARPALESEFWLAGASSAVPGAGAVPTQRRRGTKTCAGVGGGGGGGVGVGGCWGVCLGLRHPSCDPEERAVPSCGGPRPGEGVRSGRRGNPPRLLFVRRGQQECSGPATWGAAPAPKKLPQRAGALPFPMPFGGLLPGGAYCPLRRARQGEDQGARGPRTTRASGDTRPGRFHCTGGARADGHSARAVLRRWRRAFRGAWWGGGQVLVPRRARQIGQGRPVRVLVRISELEELARNPSIRSCPASCTGSPVVARAPRRRRATPSKGALEHVPPAGAVLADAVAARRAGVQRAPSTFFEEATLAPFD